MKLLIVESAGKIQKLQAILGGSWKVMASVGHIRDLPLKSIGVEAPDFKPQYEPTERGKSVIAKLKTAVASADEVYLATDPDREGEAIAWHLEDALRLTNPKRVTYCSITEKEVLDSIANARTTDMNLVKAQEARRVLDRLCGYLVSNPVSNITGEKMSAGRVQSPAIRLVVEREREIRSFVSKTHYGVELILNKFENIQEGFKAVWKPDNLLQEDEEYNTDTALAESISKIRKLTVFDFKEEEKKTAPASPFTTSALQQASSNALKIDPKKTMELAQKLYENGHITYMRTDSPNLSQEAIQSIRAFADSTGLPLVDSPRTWKSKDNAQEAHEAIRPTHIELEQVSDNSEEQALYSLIRNRAICSQLQDSISMVRTITFEAEHEGKKVYFEAKGSSITSEGWKMLNKEDSATIDEPCENKEEIELPLLEIGQELTIISGKVQTKKTQAKSRYSLASLIRELEKIGIGRPATYASILDNIVSKGYIKEEKRKLHATPLGEKLIDAMTSFFSFLEYDYTKNMEQKLDDIALAKSSYQSVIADVYQTLTNEIDILKKAKAIPCPSCQGYNLVHRYKKDSGKQKGYDFFACNDCKETFNNSNGRPTAKAPSDNGKETPFKCLECGSTLREKSTKNNGIWFACSAFPKCSAKYWANKDNQPQFNK